MLRGTSNLHTHTPTHPPTHPPTTTTSRSTPTHQPTHTHTHPTHTHTPQPPPPPHTHTTGPLPRQGAPGGRGPGRPRGPDRVCGAAGQGGGGGVAAGGVPVAAIGGSVDGGGCGGGCGGGAARVPVARGSGRWWMRGGWEGGWGELGGLSRAAARLRPRGVAQLRVDQGGGGRRSSGAAGVGGGGCVGGYGGEDGASGVGIPGCALTGVENRAGGVAPPPALITQPAEQEWGLRPPLLLFVPSVFFPLFFIACSCKHVSPTLSVSGSVVGMEDGGCALAAAADTMTRTQSVRARCTCFSVASWLCTAVQSTPRDNSTACNNLSLGYCSSQGHCYH